MKIIKKLLVLLIAFYIILVIDIKLGIAQSDQLVFNPKVQYRFGEWIEIKAEINELLVIDNISIVVTSDVGGLENSIIKEISIENNFNISILLSDSDLDWIKAFSNVKYKFVFSLSDGNQASSQEFEFYYKDNRFDWKFNENENFIVYWYQGDVGFAQTILDAAQNTLPFSTQFLNISSPPDKIEIYVYPDSNILREALISSGQDWIVGQANPESNIILVTIDSTKDEYFDISTRIPHEIIHILLFHSYGLESKNIPVWLNEGIASYAENYGVENPDSNIILNTANDNNSLLSFNSLCNQFPQDANQISIAYAQSESMVRFILEKYGTLQLEHMAKSYADGNSCENIVFSTVKINLNQLENQWKEYIFQVNTSSNSYMDLAPWIIIFSLIFFAPVGYFLFEFK